MSLLRTLLVALVVMPMLATLSARAGGDPNLLVVEKVHAALLDTPCRSREWQLLPPPADSGMRHAGAVFPADIVFPHDDALALLFSLPVQRLKAVLRTDKGWLEINATAVISEYTTRLPGNDSRVEVIVAHDAGLPDLKAILMLLLPAAAE